MLSIRLNAQAEEELKAIANFHGVSVSDFVRNIINEKLEDVYDLKLVDSALLEHKKDPKIYTLDEVEKELGL